VIYSKTSEYAIRALIELARLPRGTPAYSKEIAQNGGMPPVLLAKVLQALAGHGLVHSARGSGGGFTLVCAPETIRLLDVVRLIDGSFPKYQRCAVGLERMCSESEPCTMHRFWKDIRPVIDTFLREHTIADLATGAGYGSDAMQKSRVARRE
jgi:Rrf2 family protein